MTKAKEIETAAHDELIEAIDNTACMLRGMTMDPAIPRHAKDAMWSSISTLEALVQKHAD